MMPPEIYGNPDSELVIGLVGPTGIDFDSLVPALTDRLKTYKYESVEIRISELIGTLIEKGLGTIELQEAPEFQRVKSYMDAGNQLRQNTEPSILALAACHSINQQRPSAAEPRPRTAYILKSLKNSEEVTALRNTYGPGFFLIGLFASESDRKRLLTKQKGLSEEEAELLIERDAGEEDENGQQTRETFQLADAFAETKEDLWRILDLLFGAPFETPKPEEQAMFLAYAAATRSADLSRQVGAVITNQSHEILATGCNDAPAPGGGLYWPGENDKRDHVLGSDSNTIKRNEIIVELAKLILPPAEGEHEEVQLLERGLERFKGSGLLGLTEYGRAVHAEMEALLSCARRGASCRGGILYTTTYPCHNCARHIIAAGISKVVYVEPYPKSLAAELHGDAMTFEGQSLGEPDTGKTAFVPYIGVGPRRYLDLFSMNLSTGYQLQRKKSDGSKVDWRPESALLRCTMRTISYLEREKAATDRITEAEEAADVEKD